MARDLDETRLPKIPTHATGDDREALIQAQASAQAAIQEANDLNRQARNARRRAHSRIERYENLIAEFHGQLTLFH